MDEHMKDAEDSSSGDEDDERMSASAEPQRKHFAQTHHVIIPTSPTANTVNTTSGTVDAHDTTMSVHPPRSSGTRRHRTAEYRAERNAREKERSLRITQQIEELRQLLNDAGEVVPKLTKGSILSATIQYIKSLQQQQQRQSSNQDQDQQDGQQRQGEGRHQQGHATGVSPVVSSVVAPTQHHEGATVAVPSPHTTTTPPTAIPPAILPVSVPVSPHAVAMSPIVQAAIARIMPLILAGTATSAGATTTTAQTQIPPDTPPPLPTPTATMATTVPTVESDFAAHFESCQFGMVSVHTLQNGGDFVRDR